MKRLLLLALCALLSLNADARTLYVDAKRPNNNGNGLSKAKAKKTIQAAINVAKKGDTILVLPGTYAPIKTNNKKIAVKSVKGASKTSIVPGAKADLLALAQLGKTYTYETSRWNDWSGKMVACNSSPRSKGTATTLSGFLLDGNGKPVSGFVGISGGTAQACTIQGVKARDYEGSKGKPVPPPESLLASDCKLTACTIRDNEIECNRFGVWMIGGSTLNRCKILDNRGSTYLETGFGILGYGCKAANCLFAGNETRSGWIGAFYEATLVNCTIADNHVYSAKNSSGQWIGTAGSVFSNHSKWYNCVLRNNTKRVDVVHEGSWADDYDDEGNRIGDHWVEGTTDKGVPKIHNADKGSVYKNTDKTNKDPKFADAANGNYKLKKGSYCINKGELTAAQKKLVGTKDLAGKKRIKGKAIDRGCYEY